MINPRSMSLRQANNIDRGSYDDFNDLIYYIIKDNIERNYER